MDCRLEAVVVPLSSERENSRAFHEERTLLRIERREALVHLDLERVAFNLAEVRVDSRVERDRRRDAVFSAEADVALIVRAAPLRRRLTLLVARIGRRRDHFADEPRPELAEGQRRLLLEYPLAGFERWPGDRDAGAAHPPPEENSHVHVSAALEANRLKGHAHLHGVTLRIPAAGTVPHVVHGLIFASRHRVQHVELHAVGVDHQVVGDLPGPKRVEAEAHPVIRPDIVTARDGGLDCGRLGVLALEREIEIVGVVAEPDFCFLWNGRAVQRIVGHPLARLDGPLTPRVFVEDAVDGWRLRQQTRS